MIRPNPTVFAVLPHPFRISVCALLLAGCSGTGQVKVGSSLDANAEADGMSEGSPDDEDGDDLDDLDRDDSTSNGATAEEDEAQEEDEAGSEAKAHHEPPGAALARTALHAASAPNNHLGLVMAISERTSDLPWVLAIENRSPNPVKLAALPELLTARITAPKEEQEEAADNTAPKKTTEPEPIVCGAKSIPTSLGDDDMVELLPGQLLFHAFDPRDLCSDEAAFEEGASVEVSYGFPIQTKKLWKNGKLTTVEVEQKAPFVAEREATEENEFAPLKRLTADPFLLDQTYPLSAVSALPEEEEADEETGQRETKTPPPPLKLTISPLGTTSAPETGVVTVSLQNTSGKTMKLFIRRELFTYEVSGPLGEATCRMHPADRAPDPSAFSTLAPGESRSMSTRLAEACPAGTWDTPGNYSVSAFFQASADGSEHGFSAFMGSAGTKSAARLVVPGSKSELPKMRIVESQPPVR